MTTCGKKPIKGIDGISWKCLRSILIGCRKRENGADNGTVILFRRKPILKRIWGKLLQAKGNEKNLQSSLRIIELFSIEIIGIEVNLSTEIMEARK